MRDLAPLNLAFAALWEFPPISAIVLEMIRIRVEAMLAEMELMLFRALRNLAFQRHPSKFGTVFRGMFRIQVFALFAKMLLVFFLTSFGFASYKFGVGIKRASVGCVLILLWGSVPLDVGL